MNGSPDNEERETKPVVISLYDLVSGKNKLGPSVNPSTAREKIRSGASPDTPIHVQAETVTGRGGSHCIIALSAKQALALGFLFLDDVISSNLNNTKYKALIGKSDDPNFELEVTIVRNDQITNRAYNQVAVSAPLGAELEGGDIVIKDLWIEYPLSEVNFD